MSDPVIVSLWLPDGAEFRKVGEVGTWAALSLEPRYNTPGIWSMSLPLNAQGLSITRQHVLTFDFRGWRMTGLVEKPPGPSYDGALRMETSGVDALAKLGHYVCYPNPDGGPGQQYRARYRDDGPAETVLHDLIVSEVVDRVGYPLVVPASEGRGAHVRVNAYFKNILELVLAKVKVGGIGVRVGLVDTTPMRAQMRLEFYTPEDRSRRVILAPDLGTVSSWRAEKTVASATRAVVVAAYVETLHNVEHFDLSRANALTLPGDDVHDFRTGDRIRFTGRNDPPDPLDRSTDYFAIRVDADTFKVAKNQAKALDRNEINITDFGLVIQNVNSGNDNLTISDGAVPRTGSRVRFHGGGNLPNPLNKGDVYYAIKVDRDTFKVANTETAANNGDAINLTTDKSGEVRVFEAGSIKVVEVKRQARVVDAAPDLDVHDIREVFVDARSEDADDNDVYTEKGNEALLNGAANTTFELAAVEADGMQFGTHYDIGDLVTVQLLPKTDDDTDTSTVTNLGAVRLASTPDAGTTVELVPGAPDGSSPLFKQAALIRALRAQVRALQEDS